MRTNSRPTIQSQILKPIWENGSHKELYLLLFEWHWRQPLNSIALCTSALINKLMVGTRRDAPSLNLSGGSHHGILKSRHEKLHVCIKAWLWKHGKSSSVLTKKSKELKPLKKDDALFRDFNILARSHNLLATEMSFPIAHKFLLQTNRRTDRNAYRPWKCQEIYFRWGCIIPAMSRKVVT